MKDFIFHETSPDELKVFDFEPSLFHNPKQLYLQRADGWKWFAVEHPKHKRIVASLYLHIDIDGATSAVNSPFGTVEFARKLSPDVLYQFLQFVEARLRALNVQRIRLKNPPTSYAPYQIALLETFLFNLGYTVRHAETGTSRDTNTEFIQALNRLERRKLQKAQAASITCRLVPTENLEQIYSFILTCRQQKGYSLSMTLKELQAASEKFPEHYLLFGAFLGDELTAASIAVRISPNVLYNFYTDHAKPYDAFSPAVTVVEGLYRYCQEHAIPILDMGTSNTDGLPLFGLLNFKLRLGGKPTSKLIFEKSFVP